MADVKVFFDGPHRYPGKDNIFFSDGNSPFLLEKFFQFLENNESKMCEIYASLYLFNNRKLHEKFIKLSSKGIKISVISIPLEGYDPINPKKILEQKTNTPAFHTPMTKHQLANEVYTDFKNHMKNGNYKLYIFPHMYLRSPYVKKFSRGNMPYSLHIKSFFIKYKDGNGAVILTSSNLAVRDKIKDEVMVIIDRVPITNIVSSPVFYKDLIHNSVEYPKFDENQNWLKYCIIPCSQPDKISNFYTGPFYKNSQDRLEKVLIKLIQQAQNRIYVCAQHICAYKYGKSEGILSHIIDKGRQGVDIRFLSQTFVDENGDSHGCRKPGNKKSFMVFIRDLKSAGLLKYAVKESVHCKYILIDNLVIVCSFNLTPTQFIYLDNVDIPKFVNMPQVHYNGIHSEVSHYLLIKNQSALDQFIDHFDSLWKIADVYPQVNGVIVNNAY